MCAGFCVNRLRNISPYAKVNIFLLPTNKIQKRTQHYFCFSYFACLVDTKLEVVIQHSLRMDEEVCCSFTGFLGANNCGGIVMA